MKTFSARAQDIDRQWLIVDADGATLGRLAAEVVHRLRGKHKPEYTPHVDTGDYVIIINAEKIKVTGNKGEGKIYYRHSGYPGGLKTTSFNDMIKTHPERALEIAIKGMLPNNPLGRDTYRKLKVYVGPEHPHAAQSPVVLNLRKAVSE